MTKGIWEHLDNRKNKTTLFAAFPEENQSVAEGLLLPADFVFHLYWSRGCLLQAFEPTA